MSASLISLERKESFMRGCSWEGSWSSRLIPIKIGAVFSAHGSLDLFAKDDQPDRKLVASPSRVRLRSTTLG
jgi:hypothetical protein